MSYPNITFENLLGKMSRSRNEEWERRKWYLVRNLFEDVLLLSPIPETQEQSFDLRSPTEAALRPYSPLPDLIIEKEPNRHDEPEEYYQDLEKKIKKIYRRLFLETENSDSSTEEIDEMIFRAGIGTKAAVEAILPEHSNIGRNQFSEEGCSREETIASAEQMTESSNSSSGDRSGSTESFDSSSIKRSKSHESANRSSVEHSETNESNGHSGVNSNSSAKSSKSIEHNEECLIEEKSISTRSLEGNDTSSMSTSHHEIIVTQAQIHDAGKKQIESASHMKLASSLDKVSSEQDYFPRISHHEIIRQAQIQDAGRKHQAEKAEEAHIGPTTPLDKETFLEVYLPSTSHLEIIVTQAETHDTTALSPLERATEDDPPVISGSKKRNESKSTDIIARVTNTEVSEAEHERSELESLQSCNNRGEIIEFAVPSVHSDASSLDEPEAMRRRRTSNLPVHSPNAFNGRRYSSTGIDFEYRKSAREMEEETGDFSLISEPNRKSKSQEERHSRRRILSEISTRHKPSKRSKQNLATQTSFSSSTDVENNWEEIRTNFFEGNPVIYKLCTCNHVCR